ncbi:hypothetical protein D1AOALGA4SA_9631 [Olavius algarvensis Delta 1 endosymbiont]|nr:hypothetical protein D1AOALGA4SA_9631 [Olavius algarvensis Delta 1 endosymbiont]
MHKNSGFTAFELALSMAVVAIMAAVVLPPYTEWLREHRLDGSVNNLLADLEMAKIRAIRENSFVVIEFEATQYTIFLDNGQTDSDPGNWDPAGEIVIKTRTLPSGVEFDMALLNFVDENLDPRDATRFDGRGLPDCIIAAVTITLTNQAEQRLVSLNRLGFLRVL